MKQILKIKICSIVLMLISQLSFANVTLPHLIGSNMVLQSGTLVKIWGNADPGEKVSVNFRGQTVTALTDQTGNWSLFLNPFSSDKINTFTMTVSGNNTIVLNNILCGEVWMCAGQSNMQWRVKDSNNSAEEISTSKNNKIRLFQIKPETSAKVKTDADGTWVECSPETVPNFTAIGYFFGKSLIQKIDVPVGLIMSAYGGSRINAWMSKKSLVPINAFDTTGNKANVSSSIYNAIIYPVHNYTLKAILWYQGETGGSIPKMDREEAYRILFVTMISDWRECWNNKQLPFIFAQLSSDDTVFIKGRKPNTGTSGYAIIRGSQFSVSKSVANTGMGVTYDLGDPSSTHYKNKQEAGRRLSLVARNLVYGEKNLVWTGPVFDHFTIKGNKVRLYFTNCGSGLVIKEGENGSAFTVAGKNMEFVKANAVVKGNSVIVSAKEVNEPVEVRYAWYDIPFKLSYLYNKEGLPAASFRTGGTKSIAKIAEKSK
jgi:sialate O-acetylesterase